MSFYTQTMHLVKVTRVVRNGLKWIKYDPTIRWHRDRWHRDKIIYYHISILGVGCGYTDTMITPIFLLVAILFFIFCVYMSLF